jgi:hypothetical protein
MKKLLITAAILAVSATAAQAEISVGIGINQPGYYAPAPVYIEPARRYYPTYSNDRHRNYDWSYWHPQPVRVVEVRRDYDDRDEHHDNGNRGNYQKRGNSGHGKDKGHR